MKILQIILFYFAFSCLYFAQSAPEILHFTSRMGFESADERIVAQKFFDEDGKLVLIGKKSIQFWETASGKLSKTVSHDILNLDKSDTVVKISPDARMAIVLNSFSFRIIRKERKVSATVWDLQTGKQISVLERPSESIRDAEWSANGETLVTYSGIFNDKITEVSFWDGVTLKFRSAILLKGYLEWKYLNPDGSRFFTLVSSGQSVFLSGYRFESSVNIWNAQTAKIEQHIGGEESLGTYGFPNPLNPSETLLALVSRGKISVWKIGGSDLPKYEIKAAKKDEFINFKNFSDDGKFLIAYQNKTLEFYDAENGELKFSLPNIKNYEDVNLRADGETLVLQNCEQLDVFDLLTRRKLYELKLVCKTQFDLISTDYRDFDTLRFHPNENLLLTFSDKTVRVWNTQNGALLQTVVDPNRAANKRKDRNKDDGLRRSAGWLMNGNYLYASGADDKSILFWELDNNK